MNISQIDHQNIPVLRLAPEAKKAIALDALSGMGIAQAARKHDVCRNSVYTQKREAEAAIDQTFTQKAKAKVLFHLPVTRHLIN
jgi:transposase-like protein